ncbi:hypothetical protein BV898_06329 [Hypsibius exemplaris]|uniref:Uncharacterized protein n=1 Tax=Hypsibius exemplaris TaxID=2072580 RepID=A0A1W0WWJ5_HYPEX|nr:hypothetical protein BV898_06329 [Hypsibius exemplaris]
MAPLRLKTTVPHPPCLTGTMGLMMVTLRVEDFKYAMIITTDEQLKDLLPSLTQHHSKSWQLEAMVRNRVNGRWRWPGTEFVVDKFPDYSVLMCRPVKDSPEYIPWPHATNTVTIFAKTPEALDAVIRRDDCLD